MKPSWRKPAGVFLILAWIALWAALAVAVAPFFTRLGPIAEGLFYLVAGIAWILPLKPLLRWAERGGQ
ncbi:MAG: DUF2842 domain-containing protein [Sphingomonadaceae bacterium]